MDFKKACMLIFSVFFIRGSCSVSAMMFDQSCAICSNKFEGDEGIEAPCCGGKIHLDCLREQRVSCEYICPLCSENIKDWIIEKGVYLDYSKEVVLQKETNLDFTYIFNKVLNICENKTL